MAYVHSGVQWRHYCGKVTPTVTSLTVTVLLTFLRHFCRCVRMFAVSITFRVYRCHCAHLSTGTTLGLSSFCRPLFALGCFPSLKFFVCIVVTAPISRQVMSANCWLPLGVSIGACNWLSQFTSWLLIAIRLLQAVTFSQVACKLRLSHKWSIPLTLITFWSSSSVYHKPGLP